MTHAILVISPSPAFAELIRQSLELGGDVRVKAVQSASEALGLCRATLFDIAILDGDLANQPLPQLGREIQRCCPRARLLVFPPDNNPKSAALAGGKFQAVLKKPFYLPALQKTIKNLLSKTVLQEVAAESVEPLAKDSAWTSQAEVVHEEAATESEDLPAAVWPGPDLPLAAVMLPPETPEDEPPDASPVINLQELEKLDLEWIGPEALPQQATEITFRSDQAAPGPAEGEVTAPAPEVDSHIKDTQPIHRVGASQATPSALAFTCALTPQLAAHYLRPGQINTLKKCLLETCTHHSWQVVWLSIRPSHLAWSVRIPAGADPEEMIRACRQNTSEELFKAYPPLGFQNPNGDFWSSGHLQAPGELSLSRQDIYEFATTAHPSSSAFNPSSLSPYPS